MKSEVKLSETLLSQKKEKTKICQINFSIIIFRKNVTFTKFLAKKYDIKFQ